MSEQQSSFQLGPLQTKWVEALESGEFKQGKECLFDGTGFCCLGVAAKLMDKKFIPAGDVFTVDGDAFLLKAWEEVGLLSSSGLLSGLYSGEVNSMAEEFKSESELRTAYSLAELNDFGVSFSVIAKIIRTYPQAVFTESK